MTDREQSLATAMKRSAEREMRACRRAWNLGDVEGDWIGEVVPSKGRKRTIAERIKPYIGTGMKQREVAEILGCTRGPIVKALKKLGARL